MAAFVAAYPFERGIRDPRVLAALRKVPRHEFVPEAQHERAYTDGPLDIGEGQTISQPFIVGFMSEALELKASDRVLEIGAGSGYQTAILAELVGEVYAVEISESLAQRAQGVLERLQYRNVHVRCADGALGWKEAAPFDAILIACAAPQIPAALVEQLQENGRLILPLDHGLLAGQELVLAQKTKHGLRQERRMAVRFVPMIRPTSRPG